MIPKHMMQRLKQQFVTWARSKGIKKPNTDAALNVLFAQFMMEQPAWFEVTGDKPAQLTWDGATTQIVDARNQPADDFDELQDRREAAMVEGGGDDLAREVIMMQQDAERLRRDSPPVLSNPLSAKDGPLGGQAAPNAAGQNGIEVARWAGEDIEATNFVITASPVWEAGVAQPASITQRTFLQVQWGMRNSVQYIEVDVGKGCEFTLAGSFVTVAVACEASAANNNAQPIVAGVAFREGNRTTALTRTKVFANINGAQTVPIVPFAKKFWVMLSAAAATATVSVQEPDATVLETFTQTAAFPPQSPYALPGSAANLVITTSQASNLTVVFELCV